MSPPSAEALPTHRDPRYDKLAANFLAMVQLTSMPLWLRACHWWRPFLKPFRHLGRNDPVLEILVTGLDITPKMILTHELEVSNPAAKRISASLGRDRISSS